MTKKKVFTPTQADNIWYNAVMKTQKYRTKEKDGTKLKQPVYEYTMPSGKKKRFIRPTKNTQTGSYLKTKKYKRRKYVRGKYKKGQAITKKGEKCFTAKAGNIVCGGSSHNKPKKNTPNYQQKMKRYKQYLKEERIKYRKENPKKPKKKKKPKNVVHFKKKYAKTKAEHIKAVMKQKDPKTGLWKLDWS